MRNHRLFLLAGVVLAGLWVPHGAAQGDAFTYKKVMVPVRDGIKL
jgi:hypothetical protein